MAKLSLEEAKAIIAVKNGADIWGYHEAGLYRKMERRGIKGLFTITKAMMAPKDGAKQQPYFGCIATAAGITLAKKTIAASKGLKCKKQSAATLKKSRK